MSPNWIPESTSPDPTPQSLRVAAIQMKFAATMDGNLAAMERLLGSARLRRTDAVLFPECALTGYDFDFSRLTPSDLRRSLTAVGEMAARFRINLLVGTPVFRQGRLHNGLVVFDRLGRVVHCYAKCHLTEWDRQWFTPGNAIALFRIDGICATAIICHERRYPELVRLAVMAGARIVCHPNAGLDSLAVSRTKRKGQDGVAARAFENAIPYVFANSVGPQGKGKWSAGDSKIVAPDGRVLALAGNRDEEIVVADLDLSGATGSYALRGMEHPRFLAADWKRMVRAVKVQAGRQGLRFDLPAQKAV